jgi:N-acetylneuraminic acid mutarotase
LKNYFIWLLVASAVIFFGAAQAATWRTTGNMPVDRFCHTATLLPNGKVLAAGGYSYSNKTTLASAALYNQKTGTWTAIKSMHNVRCDHTATLLANGKVLVAGGYYRDGSNNIGIDSP